MTSEIGSIYAKAYKRETQHDEWISMRKGLFFGGKRSQGEGIIDPTF